MTGKKFAAMVAFDVALVMALALWVLLGNATAGTVFRAYFWITTPLSIAAYLIAPGGLCGLWRSAGWYIGYARGVRIAVAALLALAHETGMLAALFAAWFAFEGAYRWCVEQAMKEGATNEADEA